MLAMGSGRRLPPTKHGGASPLGCLGGAVLLLHALGFLFFRVGELVPLVATHARECIFCAVALALAPLRLRRRVPRGLWGALLFAYLAALAHLLDHGAPRPLPAPSARHAGLTAVVTGGNSGVGYATSRRLAVEYGVRVVLGCRSEARCEKAAAAIEGEIAAAGSAGSVVPLLVDLASLDSIAAFAATLVDRYQVDLLFNNAGFVPLPHTPVNEYGLEHAFTAMHLAPFLLTERLLAARPRLRVVNASSGTHHLCALPWALPPALWRWLAVGHGPGCVDEEYLTDGVREETRGAAYFQAKAANVLHAAELPRRHTGATAAVLDLGWVGTAIQPWMRGSVTPANLGWMRSADVGIVPALHALLATEEELKADLGPRRERAGVVVNAFGAAEEAFSYWWWRRGAEVDLSAARMQGRGARLWEESTRLLATLGY